MIAEVIRPSALNVMIVGAMMILFGGIWRILAAYFSDGSTGEAMAVIY
jgi:hypothetical protein